jgi:uncharacterized Rmd1/YagE family protein
LNPLAESWRSEGSLVLYDDALHVHLEGGGELFYFSYGVLVLWAVPLSEHRKYLERARAFSERPLSQTEEDNFDFTHGDRAQITKKVIILPNEDPLSKLAFSHALAQSAQLGVFEQTIAELIRATDSIPRELALTGKQPLKAKDIRKMMGRLYVDLSSVNLHFDLLDEPEFFWDYEELEPLYSMASRYLDIEDRVHVLNQRLQVVRDLFEMLSDELKHQHSSRLEWTIIWLILLEVVITLAKDVFSWI